MMESKVKPIAGVLSTAAAVWLEEVEVVVVEVGTVGTVVVVLMPVTGLLPPVVETVGVKVEVEEDTLEVVAVLAVVVEVEELPDWPRTAIGRAKKRTEENIWKLINYKI